MTRQPHHGFPAWWTVPPLLSAGPAGVSGCRYVGRMVSYKSREKGSPAAESQASQIPQTPPFFLFIIVGITMFSGTFHFIRSICWLRWDLLSFQKANSAQALEERLLLTVRAFAELFFKDLGACGAFLAGGDWPRQLEKSTESKPRGCGVGVCFPLALLFQAVSWPVPGLAWGPWAALFHPCCDYGYPSCPLSAPRSLSGGTRRHALQAVLFMTSQYRVAAIAHAVL